MQKIAHIKTHTQLGDHMICYGFIKEFAKKYENIFLYTKAGDDHLKNVKRLFASIPNVKIVVGNPLLEYKNIICDTQWYVDVKGPKKESLVFDRYWYNLAQVPFHLKWDNFYLERDLEKEKDVFYNILGLTDDDNFIFLHDDPSRNFNINKHYSENVRIINPRNYQNVSVFDFLFTIKKSKEVHVINSVFRTLIDLVNINHNNLFYHKYTRPVWSEQPGCKLNWKIIE